MGESGHLADITADSKGGRAMTIMKLWTVAALAGSLCSCSPGTSEEAEVAKLMQTSREWSKVAASGDMNAALAYFADDAVMMAESQAPVRGKAAIRDYLAASSKIPGFRIEWEPLEGKVSGDLGYLIERTKVTMTGPQGKPVVLNQQALTVWRKQADGTWKNVVDMTTSEAPRR
jgi:uncharacterized protein (TIGR02246 family)